MVQSQLYLTEGWMENPLEKNADRLTPVFVTDRQMDMEIADRLTNMDTECKYDIGFCLFQHFCKYSVLL